MLAVFGGAGVGKMVLLRACILVLGSRLGCMMLCGENFLLCLYLIKSNAMYIEKEKPAYHFPNAVFVT